MNTLRCLVAAAILQVFLAPLSGCVSARGDRGFTDTRAARPVTNNSSDTQTQTLSSPGARAQSAQTPSSPPAVPLAQAQAIARMFDDQWTAAIKTVPILQKKIAQGASFAEVTQQALALEGAGYARLSLADLRAKAEFDARLGEFPQYCESLRSSTLPVAGVSTVATIQQFGAEAFEAHAALRIRALRAGGTQTGEPHTVTAADYQRVTRMAMQTLPFNVVERIRQVQRQGSKNDPVSSCWVGLAVLKAGLKLPKPYSDILVIGLVGRRIVASPPVPHLLPSRPPAADETGTTI